MQKVKVKLEEHAMDSELKKGVSQNRMFRTGTRSRFKVGATTSKDRGLALY